MQVSVPSRLILKGRAFPAPLRTLFVVKDLTPYLSDRALTIQGGEKIEEVKVMKYP